MMNGILNVESITFKPTNSSESVMTEEIDMSEEAKRRLNGYISGDELNRNNQFIVINSISAPMDKAYMLYVQSEGFYIVLKVADWMGEIYNVSISNVVVESQNPEPDLENHLTIFRNVILNFQRHSTNKIEKMQQ